MKRWIVVVAVCLTTGVAFAQFGSFRQDAPSKLPPYPEAEFHFGRVAYDAGGRCAGMAAGHYVTLDMTTHFLSRGQVGVPLDAHVELVRQTRSHVFLQGVVRQDGEPCYSFTGTLKRIRDKNAPA